MTKRIPDLPRHTSITETVQALRAPHPLTDDSWIIVGDPIDPGDDQATEASGLKVTPDYKGTWTAVPNSSYAPLSFYLDDNGDVRFIGHIQGGVVGDTIIKLPEGFRPEYTVTFILPNDGAGYSKVKVEPDGDVILIEQVTV